MKEMKIYVEPLTKEESSMKKHQDDILRVPVRYNLIDCLKQLQFGRPISNQKQIDKWIKELKANPKNAIPFN